MEKIVVRAKFVGVPEDVFATVVEVVIDEAVLAAEFGLKIALLTLQDPAASRLMWETAVRPRRTYCDLSPLSISYFTLYSRPFIQYLLSCFEELCLKAL